MNYKVIKTFTLFFSIIILFFRICTIGTTQYDPINVNAPKVQLPLGVHGGGGVLKGARAG